MNVRKFGHLLIRSTNGRDLGDVDVLAVDASRRRLIALECKDFEMDRMPHEVHDDVRTLFDDTKHASALTKHERRIEWLRSNAPAVARHLAGDSCGGEWSVVGGIVLSRALAAPMLRAARLPIWTFADIDKADWDP